MERHDPLLFDLPVPTTEKITDTWQRGGNHYYFYTHYCAPDRMTAEQVHGFELVKLWDANRHTAEVAARVFYGKPKVCNRFEDVSDDVDLVFIADCTGEGKDHLTLATPGLKKGVATFVDKPFAYTLRDVHALCRLSDRHKAPLLSLSMLLVSPAVLSFRQRLAETWGPNMGTIQGGGARLDGLIHSISLAQAIFGFGIESVQAMAGPRQTVVHLDYGGNPHRPKQGVTIICDAGKTFHSAFYATAVGPRSAVLSIDLGDWENPRNSAAVLRLVRQMVRTGKAPVPRAQMIECVAVAEAFRKALATGEQAKVPKAVF